MQKQIKLSIIIPALNEADIIADTLQKVRNFMVTKMPAVNYEVIVVAAQDKDNTAKIATEQAKLFGKNQLTVINPKSRVGKGRDVALGFKAAKGDVQIFTDADLALPLINIKKMYEILSVTVKDGDNAAVFGVRSHKHNSFKRKVMSFIGSLVTRVLFFTNITDLQCGLKGFTASAAAVGFKNIKTVGWTFDVEVFANLKKAKIPVLPLQIDAWQSDVHHLGGENLLKVSVNSFIDMIKIRFR